MDSPQQTERRIPCQPNGFRVAIDAVRELKKPRPQWSVLIPTHNCAVYLEQTLQSVLRQDPGWEKMEIIVVDDCSTKDDPSEVVRRLGQGRVQFIQQSENVGQARNFQTGLNASRGQLIHQLHGDDMVGGCFYQSMEKCFQEFPEAGAFFCESEYVDENNKVTGRTGQELSASGLLNDWLARIYVQQRIQTPSIVVRRDVYEQLGGFDQRLPPFEDWEMWVRAATKFSFGFNADCIAHYRVYTNNTSRQSILSGRAPRVLTQVLSIVDSYVPEGVQQKYRATRSREMAYYLIGCLPIAIQHHRPMAWLRLCFHIMSYSLRPRVLYYMLLLTGQNIRFVERPK